MIRKMLSEMLADLVSRELFESLIFMVFIAGVLILLVLTAAPPIILLLYIFIGLAFWAGSAYTRVKKDK